MKRNERNKFVRDHLREIETILRTHQDPSSEMADRFGKEISVAITFYPVFHGALNKKQVSQYRKKIGISKSSSPKKVINKAARAEMRASIESQPERIIPKYSMGYVKGVDDPVDKPKRAVIKRRNKQKKKKGIVRTPYPIDLDRDNNKSTYDPPALKPCKKPSKKYVRKLEYKTYLKSKQWARKRKEVFKHHGEYCFRCRTTSNLHVHHLTYKHIFNEPMEDLIVLCKFCHSEEHKRINAERSAK